MRRQGYVKGTERGIYGEWYTGAALYSEIVKDRKFYEGELSREEWAINEAAQLEKLPGGVTFSGGEALLQIWELEPILQKLKEDGIHMAVETALFVPAENVVKAAEWIDLFYVDIKIMEQELCAAIELGDLRQYLENLKYLLCWRDVGGKRKPVVARIPVIGGYTDGKENRARVVELLAKHQAQGNGPLKIELIKEHNLGMEKYRSLGYETPKYQGVTDALIETFKSELAKLGIPIQICRL